MSGRQPPGVFSFVHPEGVRDFSKGAGAASGVE